MQETRTALTFRSTSNVETIKGDACYFFNYFSIPMQFMSYNIKHANKLVCQSERVIQFKFCSNKFSPLGLDKFVLNGLIKRGAYIRGVV